MVSLCCVNLSSVKEQQGNIEKKFFLGRLSTDKFQKHFSEAFRQNLYIVDEYYNSSTDSKIISEWKISYIDDDSTTIEYRTRFIIIGLIDNSTYSKTNSFQYECYLEVENYSYKNGIYFQEYDSNFIRNEISAMKDVLDNQTISR